MGPILLAWASGPNDGDENPKLLDLKTGAANLLPCETNLTSELGVESLRIAGNIDLGCIQKKRTSSPSEYSGAGIRIDGPEDVTFECGNIEEVDAAGLQLALNRGDRVLAGEHGDVWHGKGRRAGENRECCSVEPSRIAQSS